MLITCSDYSGLTALTLGNYFSYFDFNVSFQLAKSNNTISWERFNPCPFPGDIRNIMGKSEQNKISTERLVIGISGRKAHTEMVR